MLFESPRNNVEMCLIEHFHRWMGGFSPFRSEESWVAISCRVKNMNRSAGDHSLPNRKQMLITPHGLSRKKWTQMSKMGRRKEKDVFLWPKLFFSNRKFGLIDFKHGQSRSPIGYGNFRNWYPFSKSLCGLIKGVTARSKNVPIYRTRYRWRRSKEITVPVSATVSLSVVLN